MPIKRTSQFDFLDLFIFEMANNHTGDLEHGKRIVREFGAIAKEAGVRAAMKLQFRELDTFIHPAHKGSKTNKHIPRFESTRLSEEQFAELVAEIKLHNLISMCTPFDEPSVDMIERLGIEVIKIGSCSATDRPLLEKISEIGKPVICSTAGLKISNEVLNEDEEDIDWIATFFRKRGVHFAFMHCVGDYSPMPPEAAHLNQIAIMKNRYPDITIGWSTHEDPSDTVLVGLAYAKGARIFEKHVGIPNPEKEIVLNKYSANPEQVEKWLAAYKNAVAACGNYEQRVIRETEKRDLDSLKRGVFARREIKKGEKLESKDTFFAIPVMSNQLRSGQWMDGLIVDCDYKENEAMNSFLVSKIPTHRKIIFRTINMVIGMLNEAKIVIGHDFSVELSHHDGLENFQDVGCTLITCFNREEYAKKIIVQLPGQLNPEHYHKKKDETFHILSGVLEVEIEGKPLTRREGESLWIPRGTSHSFHTDTGCIFEEVSTKDWPDDSFYTDRSIAKKDRKDRKTFLQNWGRYQFD